MGMFTESQILTQAKKGQGETNVCLDRIAEAVEAQNQLLSQLLAALGTSTVRP